MNNMLDQVHMCDAATLLEKLGNDSVDIILTDPPYDFPRSVIEDITHKMSLASKNGVIVFCPPENQWFRHPDQYLFWIKPISTKKY